MEWIQQILMNHNVAGVSIILNIIFIGIIINLFFKISTLKVIIVTFYQMSIKTYLLMNKIDSSGMFKTDDVVGEVFTSLKTIIDTYANNLNDILSEEKNG